eukprot:10414658-Ditylum_brightwellii.AAC.1
MDKEFDYVKGELSAIRMDLNPTAAAEHGPNIERSNRTMKEQVQSVYCTLPYMALPNIMIEELVNFCVMWLNAFPPKSGLSATLSPRVIVVDTNLNIKRHFCIPFGSYAQTHEEESGSVTTELSLGATCLGSI